MIAMTVYLMLSSSYFPGTSAFLMGFCDRLKSKEQINECLFPLDLLYKMGQVYKDCVSYYVSLKFLLKHKTDVPILLRWECG